MRSTLNSVLFKSRPLPAVNSVSVDANVIVSEEASVVMVTFEPPASVSVSVLASATTSSCPATLIVLKTF